MSLLDSLTAHQLPFVIFFAYLLDIFIGDPGWLPHPVRWIGRYILFLEGKIRVFARPPLNKRIGGIFLFLIVVGTVFSLVWFILLLATHHSSLITFILSVFFAYTTLSIKSLHKEAMSVIHALDNISIGESRKRLSNIVGRDTNNLSEEEIRRAAIETVAENTSDGIIAPLFYLVIGGPALAMAYKAVNTLDSMIGYKNEKYEDVGWFSARMDDIANFIPSRLTALLMIIASFIMGLKWRNSLKIVWRDSRKHPSPNAGYPEAAVAGALGLQLGGVNYYFGVPHNRPVIGDGNEVIASEAVQYTVRIMHLTAILGVAAAMALLWFVGCGKSF